METCHVLVYFMSEDGQELVNLTNPHWAVVGLHDMDKSLYLDVYAQYLNIIVQFDKGYLIF